MGSQGWSWRNTLVIADALGSFWFAERPNFDLGLQSKVHFGGMNLLDSASRQEDAVCHAYPNV